MVYTLSASVGDATANGVSASVTQAGSATIPCTTGNAVANGATSGITQSATLPAGVGNAVANGLSCALLSGDTINASVGNASAIGVAAGVTSSGEDFGYIGGWENVSPPEIRKKIGKERVRLGISKETAKKLKRVFRLAHKKNKNPDSIDYALELKQVYNEEWNNDFGIWLDMLHKVWLYNSEKADDRRTLYALEEYRIHEEERDIVFVLTLMSQI